MAASAEIYPSLQHWCRAREKMLRKRGRKTEWRQSPHSGSCRWVQRKSGSYPRPIGKCVSGTNLENSVQIALPQPTNVSGALRGAFVVLAIPSNLRAAAARHGKVFPQKPVIYHKLGRAGLLEWQW